MAIFTSTNFAIEEIVRLSDKKQLILQPKFQRRAAWRDDARSYLIDTIVRRLPMPKIYLRRVVNQETKLKAYEVVDGQQRLRAIIDYSKDRLILDIKHNRDLGGVSFSDLPDPVQRAFMTYEITADVVEGASDTEIWALFERLNTYTLTLNTQERLNSRYFGYFKQVAYKLAADEESLATWQDLRVCSDRQISRMKEVELTSDVLMAIIAGILDISEIGKMYAKYDDEFPMKDSAIQTFKQTLAYIRNNLENPIRSTRFHSVSWFYSIMVATADAIFGIPRGDGKRALQPAEEICQRLYVLHSELKVAEPVASLSDLADTRTRATGHVRERMIRHKHFYNMLTLPPRDWCNLYGLDLQEDL